MLSHLKPLGLVERRGLAKDGVGHTDFSDVVKKRAELKRDRLLFAESEFATEPKAEVDDALRVAARLRVSLVERGCQRLKRRAVRAFERAQRFVQFSRAPSHKFFEVVLVCALADAQVVVFERAVDCDLDVL